MKLSERSFPYPVVGNADDVPNASFQATVEITFDAENVYIHVSVATSSKTLLSLVGDGAACYAAHIECSNTLFRGLQRSRESRFVYPIPKIYLNDTVEVSVVALAASDIDEYFVDGQHPEYGQHRFAVRQGDILAIYPSLQFDVERDYTSFQRIDSILTVVNSGEGVDHPMRVQLESQKILVILSDTDFQHFAIGRTGPIAQTLAAAVVLPVIMEALRVLCDEGEELDYRWCRALRTRMEELGLNLDGDFITIAQTVLELPIKRALSSVAALEME